MVRIGLLYPTRDAGEDDFVDLAGRLGLDLRVCYFPWPEDVIDLAAMDVDQVTDALRRLGSDEHLAQALPAHGCDAVAFAVTSSSFLTDPDHQVRTLRRLAGVPATSTTAAFQQATRTLGLDAVALASVYHPAVSDHFVARIQEAGAEVVNRVDASAGSDRELAGWSAERIVDLVARAAHPRAQAVLLPETALHANRLTAELEHAAGCPVLTATQVTLWSAARLLGLHPTVGDSGPLFTRTADPGVGAGRTLGGQHRETISSGSPLEPRIGFSRATRKGKHVAVAGTAPIGDDGKTVGHGDVYAQTVRCLDIAEAALEAAGAALGDVVRTRIMLTDVTRWQEAARAHGERFAAVRPAATVVEVSRFIDPDWLVEVELDAILD